MNDYYSDSYERTGGESYSYDRHGDFVDETEDIRKKYKVKTVMLICMCIFTLSEMVISALAVAPRMISVFPRRLVFSIGLCLAALAGYIAAVVFTCAKVSKRVKSEDYLKVVLPAYAVPFALSWILVIFAEIGARAMPGAVVVTVVQQIIVWAMAPLRLLRMFGMNNIFSFILCHAAIIAGILAVYAAKNMKIQAEQEGKVTKIKKRRLIKSKATGEIGKKRKQGGIRKNTEKTPKKKRAATKNFFAASNNKKRKPRKKAVFGKRRKQSIGVFMSKLTKKKKHF